ncbi:MAG: hypothetical protein DME26_15750 [Verrucomicrobia bacterium]|nr:MAG: hypothetical protein DME26_15750 [Verrucomicrobiota bacterium]
MAVDSAAIVYVADTDNLTIRKVTPDGVVTTLAGSAGQDGSADGIGNAARFYNPGGLAVDSAGNVYVADSGNTTIRKVTPGGVVTTLAGSPPFDNDGNLIAERGSADGIGSAARFGGPLSVAVEGTGNLYVADNDRITKGTPVIVPPRFGGLSINGGALTATLSGISFPVQTNIVSGTLLSVSRSIGSASGAEFLRAVVK